MARAGAVPGERQRHADGGRWPSQACARCLLGQRDRPGGDRSDERQQAPGVSARAPQPGFPQRLERRAWRCCRSCSTPCPHGTPCPWRENAQGRVIRARRCARRLPPGNVQMSVHGGVAPPRTACAYRPGRSMPRYRLPRPAGVSPATCGAGRARQPLGHRRPLRRAERVPVHGAPEGRAGPAGAPSWLPGRVPAARSPGREGMPENRDPLSRGSRAGPALSPWRTRGRGGSRHRHGASPRWPGRSTARGRCACRQPRCRRSR